MQLIINSSVKNSSPFNSISLSLVVSGEYLDATPPQNDDNNGEHRMSLSQASGGKLSTPCAIMSPSPGWATQVLAPPPIAGRSLGVATRVEKIAVRSYVQQFIDAAMAAAGGSGRVGRP